MNSKLSRLISRILPPLTLFEWGGLLTYFCLSHRISAFLHPVFRPLVLVAGVLLLLSAGCVAWFGGSAGAFDCGCSQAQIASSPWRSLLVFAILILPIAGAAALSPDTFSNAFIESRSLAAIPGAAASQKFAAAFVPIPASQQPRSVSMLDLMLAAQDEWCQKDFTDRPLQLIGRYCPDNPHYFGLITTLITCCAVDAQTLAIRVDTRSAPDLDKLAWVRVVGTVRFDQSDGATVPILTAASVTPIDSPADPYLYRPTGTTRHDRPAHH
ncbi:MAG: TIGR03943 family putative permease subunit [Chthoniobacteraceae bacterium]